MPLELKLVLLNPCVYIYKRILYKGLFIDSCTFINAIAWIFFRWIFSVSIFNKCLLDRRSRPFHKKYISLGQRLMIVSQ